MKKAKRFILFALLIIMALSIGWWFTMRINTDFATQALLEFHYQAFPRGYNPDASISVVITDENDILVLQEMLRGRSFRDSLACGFSADISITMTNGGRSITFLPANDGCPILRIGDSNRYLRVTDDAITRLHEIFMRYGGFFPCI